MKIAIDCRSLSIPMCGITRYLLNLTGALTEIDNENEYLLISDKEFSYKINLPGNFKKIKIKRTSNFLWEQVALPAELIKNKIDVFHCPQNYGVPIVKKWKAVLTIHDIIPKIFANYWRGKSKFEKFIYDMSLKNAVSKADAIMVDSENTKRDLLKIFAADGKKAEVVPIAVAPVFKPAGKSEIESVRSKYGISKNYVLHGAGIGFNKNTNVVLSAFKKLKSGKSDIQLVIFGPKKYFNEAALKSAENAGSVIFTDYVPDEDMPALYSGARLFLYPSLYEGYGLPALEAMACGVPVIVSRASSINEVVGGAGEYINDPKDADEISNKSLKMLEDSHLAESFISKGFAQVQKFSRRVIAEKVLNVYQK